MNIKINNHGYCLNCKKGSKRTFCDRKCYLEYVRKNLSNRKRDEQQQRDQLTDRIVKRSIWIETKGKINFSQITQEMVFEKRAKIILFRQRKEELKNAPLATIEKELPNCEICGEKTSSRNNKTCSNECRMEKARQRSFKNNKAKKLLIERKCKECDKPFTPEYGNKRRNFCSDECSDKFIKRGNPRKNKERADHFGVLYEYVNAFKVFDHAGWRCQICGKKTPKKNRGTYLSNAPELDHRIPISRGGDHLYSNVQCACRSCNGKKSNHNNSGQLPLFETGSIYESK